MQVLICKFLLIADNGAGLLDNPQWLRRGGEVRQDETRRGEIKNNLSVTASASTTCFFILLIKQ